MYTVELLEAALTAAKKLGYRIRVEPLDGASGGACEIGGRRWLFLDAAQGPLEHLHQTIELLRQAPQVERLVLAPELATLVRPRRNGKRQAG